MQSSVEALSSSRYKLVTEEKAEGATYTPKNLADFVAEQLSLIHI